MYGNPMEDYPEEEDWKTHKAKILNDISALIVKHKLENDVQIVLSKSATGNKDAFSEYVIATEERKFSFVKISKTVNWNRKPHSKLMFDVEDFFLANKQFKYFNGFQFDNFLKIGDTFPFPLVIKDAEFEAKEFEPQLDMATVLLFFHLNDPSSVALIKHLMEVVDVEKTKCFFIYGEILKNRKSAKYIVDQLAENGIKPDETPIFFFPKPNKKEDIFDYIKLSDFNTAVLLFDKDARIRYCGQVSTFSPEDITFYNDVEVNKQIFDESKKAFLKSVIEINKQDDLIRTQWTSNYDIYKQNIYSTAVENSVYKLFYPIHFFNSCSNKILPQITSVNDKIKSNCQILSFVKVSTSSDKDLSQKLASKITKNKEAYLIDTFNLIFNVTKKITFTCDENKTKMNQKEASLVIEVPETVDDPMVIGEFGNLKALHEFRSVKQVSVYPVVGSYLPEEVIFTKNGEEVNIPLDDKVTVIVFFSIKLHEDDYFLEIIKSVQLTMMEKPDEIQLIPVLRNDEPVDDNPLRHVDSEIEYYTLAPLKNLTRVYFDDPFGGNNYQGLIIDKSRQVRYSGLFIDLQLRNSIVSVAEGGSCQPKKLNFKASKKIVSQLVANLTDVSTHKNSFYQSKIEFSYIKNLMYTDDSFIDVKYKEPRLNLIIHSPDTNFISNQSAEVRTLLKKLKDAGYQVNIEEKQSGQEFKYKEACSACDGAINITKGFFMTPSEENPFCATCEQSQDLNENLLYLKCQNEGLLLAIIQDLVIRNSSKATPIDVEDPKCSLCSAELIAAHAIWMSTTNLNPQNNKEILFCDTCFNRLSCSNIKSMQGFSKEALMQLRRMGVNRENLIVKRIIQS